MNGSNILEHHRNNLADALHEWGDKTPEFAPLNISPWVAMSLMQKAIRRGRKELALGAAATLLEGSSPRLWRRLCVTAYEDVGVADFETVALVTSGLAGKTWRAKVGGEWVVASYLVERMCETIKCRGTDDLFVVCERHPAFECSRLELTYKPLSELIGLTASDAELPHRTLALWYAMGTNRRTSDVLRERRGDPRLAFDALCEKGFTNDVVEICREGFKKCGDIIVPFLILLWEEAQKSEQSIEPDDLPDEEMIGGVPCWVFDMHVREGNRAMARFRQKDCETTRWLREVKPERDHRALLGSLLFHVESGLVDRRLRWSVGDRLREMADVEVHGMTPESAAMGLRLLRNDLPILNEERSHVVASNLR
jgi:hypothetical protein